MKYLLLLALIFLVVWVLRKSLKFPVVRGERTESPSSSSVERMVQCAHCGVNQPVSESIQKDGCYYCCRAHAQDAPLAGD